MIELMKGHSALVPWLCLIFMSLVEIAPIKINPWTKFGKWFGSLINGEVLAKVDSLEIKVDKVEQGLENLRKESADKNNELRTDIEDLREEGHEREATNCRARILEFGDDIIHGISYSKEHWTTILIDVDSYETYCDEHPHYLNNVAEATIAYIKKMYQKHLENDDFL
jgi:hypothetical protein